MKTRCSNKHKRTSWLKKPITAGQYHHWLINAGSLTARLKQRYADFQVQTVAVGYAKPFIDEAAMLAAPVHRHALIREVLLLGDGQAVVFAHSVLPRSCLRGRWLGLSKLGNQPLGAKLFANPQVKRTPLSYKKLFHQHLLYQHTIKGLNNRPSFLWARRSIFSLSNANIMVTEVFLPQLLIE